MNCEHPEKRLTQRTYSNSVVHFVYQCQECGAALNSVKKSEIPERIKLITPAFDEALRTAWQKKLDAKRRESQERAEQEREERNDRWRRNYEAYLQSDEWKAKRIKVLERDDYTCQACLERHAHEVHHRSYRFCPVRPSGYLDRSFDEPLYHLVSLCAACHHNIHVMARKD